MLFTYYLSLFLLVGRKVQMEMCVKMYVKTVWSAG